MTTRNICSAQYTTQQDLSGKSFEEIAIANIQKYEPDEGMAYAIIVTIIAVIVTMWIAKATTKMNGKDSHG